jgi:predicted metal-dependent HD superfamily phosphohydrolase
VSSSDDVIRDRWRSLVGAGHDETGEQLVHRHAEVHRRYHTSTHVMWVLHHVDTLLAADEIDHRLDTDAVIAAALFHDAVYDARSTTNEAESADLAAAALREVGWTGEHQTTVRQLILATATHESTSKDCDVLLDADLAILGAPADEYDAYAAAVRFEYGFVPDTSWRVGRATVLCSFLDREHIFTTTTMRSARASQARANLQRELSSLRGED